MLKQIRDFKELMHEVVMGQGAKVPAKVVAEELTKPYFTLARELNPDDDGAKFCSSLILPTMNITDDDRPLLFLAASRGKRVVDIKRRPDGRDMAEECLQAYPAVTAFIEAARGGVCLLDLGEMLTKAIGELEDIFTRRREELEAPRAAASER